MEQRAERAVVHSAGAEAKPSLGLYRALTSTG